MHAISEALEAFRSNEGNSIVHSFDSLNDQENEDLHLDMRGKYESDEESFNEQMPSHIASKSNCGHTSTHVIFNQQKFLMTFYGIGACEVIKQ